MIFCCTNVYPGRKLACLMNANYIVTSLVKVNSQQLLLLYSDPQDHRHLLGHLRRQHQHLSRSSFRKLFVQLFRSICRHDALHYQPICSASVENAGRKMIWTWQHVIQLTLDVQRFLLTILLKGSNVQHTTK